MPNQIHHRCPRCRESIHFDKELQVCDKCEWGLDYDTCECDPASSDFTVDLDSEQDCQNAAHTLLTQLKRLKAENPETIVRAKIEVREVANRERLEEDY